MRIDTMGVVEPGVPIGTGRRRECWCKRELDTHREKQIEQRGRG